MTPVTRIFVCFAVIDVFTLAVLLRGKELLQTTSSTKGTEAQEDCKQFAHGHTGFMW